MVPGQSANDGRTRKRRVKPNDMSIRYRQWLIYKEFTCHAITNKVGSNRIQKLITPVSGKTLIEEDGQGLDRYYINSVWRRHADIAHAKVGASVLIIDVQLENALTW